MRLFIVAGDPSGDLHAGKLAEKIKQLNPQIEIFSAGGRELAKTTQQVIDLERLAVTGLFEVLTYLGKIIKAFNFLLKKIERLKPQAVILVDFPDFNLRLAKKLKLKNYKIFYYISPQVWAWRKKRINFIRKYVDKLLVIFPFEEEFYKGKGIKVVYTGHPLTERIPHGLTEKKEKIIALFPGSREKEVKRHLPIFIETKKIIGEKFQFILIKHPKLSPQIFTQAFKEGIILVERDNLETIAKSYLALASSGTATLELALLKIPTVVIYKMNFLSWLILKTMVKTNFISIANILAKEEIFPEFLQNKANSENLAKALKRLIEDKNLYLQTQNKLERIRKLLGDKPSSLTAAKEILKEL